VGTIITPLISWALRPDKITSMDEGSTQRGHGGRRVHGGPTWQFSPVVLRVFGMIEYRQGSGPDRAVLMYGIKPEAEVE